MRQSLIELMERGYVPDWLIRLGIRRLLARRLSAKVQADQDYEATDRLGDAPVEFWQYVLGPRLYYSACWWPKEARDLETAEAAMLAFICERAELGFNQDILDFGCGWGALSLWMAEFYPDSRIVAASDSSLQRDFIVARSREQGLNNVRVSAIDSICSFGSHRFDRMLLGAGFAPLRAYPDLGKRVDDWLKPGGKLLVHGVTSRQPTQPQGIAGDFWLARYFGHGPLVAEDWLPLFQDTFMLEEQWCFDGRHYQQTLDAWLANQDCHRQSIIERFRETYALNLEQAARRFQRWRLFFMAHAAAFGHHAGQPWAISHYRFAKP